MRIKPLFAWYDLWIGAYWDRDKQRLYVMLLPCLGFAVDFAPVIRFVRDPDNECLQFEVGPAQSGATCRTDGHYLCKECVHNERRNESGRDADDDV